jgi:hypothetical protein
MENVGPHTCTAVEVTVEPDPDELDEWLDTVVVLDDLPPPPQLHASNAFAGPGYLGSAGLAVPGEVDSDFRGIAYDPLHTNGLDWDDDYLVTDLMAMAATAPVLGGDALFDDDGAGDAAGAAAAWTPERLHARALPKPSKRRREDPASAAPAAASASLASSPCPLFGGDGTDLKRSRHSGTNGDGDGFAGAKQVDQVATTSTTTMPSRTPNEMAAEILNQVQRVCAVIGAREGKRHAAARAIAARTAAALDTPDELARLCRAAGQRTAQSDWSEYTRIAAAVRLAQVGLGLHRERMLKTKAPAASSPSLAACAESRPRWKPEALPREFGVLLKELGLTTRDERRKAIKALCNANGFEYPGNTCSWEDGDQPQYFNAVKHGYYFGSFGGGGAAVAVAASAPPLLASSSGGPAQAPAADAS